MKEKRKTVDVVGAVIVDGDLVLCAQRGAGGPLAFHWEFPGGKVEPGESPRQALQREIDEELQCTVDVGAEVTTTSHDYDFATVVLTTFVCSLVDGSPRLTEHAEVRWVERSALQSLDWTPADIPAVELLVQGASR